MEMITISIKDASILSIKVILLITFLIFLMEGIKKIFQKEKLNTLFVLLSGALLGITYGAGILLKEKENMSKENLIFIGVFLLIAHSLVEDPLLFVLFRADITTLITNNTCSYCGGFSTFFN